ncbi:ATP synthase subunit I, partial [Dysosmobacter welbionis]
QLPDILSRKGQQGIFPFNPGGDLGRVPPGQLSRRQVCADDGGAALHLAGVDNLVQGALNEGCGHLGSQIVQNQQIAVQHPLHVVVGLLFPGELLLLELCKDVARGVINHRMPLLADLPGNGGGEVGLSQSGCAEEQEVRRA